MRARDLDHALAIQNAVDGLTAGLHALDPAQIAHWTQRVAAGNLYVNRSTSGPIVGRQPFGGWKQSVVGATVKAGGPNYVARLQHWSDEGSAELDSVGDGVRRAAHDAALPIDEAKPVSDPALEPFRWLSEQCLSITTHRHGLLRPPLPATDTCRLRT